MSESAPSRTTGEREARITEIEANFHLCRCGRGDVGCVDEDTARWLIAELRSALSELSSARKDAEACMRFAGRALEEVRGEWGAGDWDGGDLQDAMEKCGIIESREVVEPCGEDCSCAEWGFPMRCYFESSLGTRCRELAAASRSEETRT